MVNKKAPKRKPLSVKKLRLIEKVIASFIDRMEIRCPESVHQCDRVIENAYWFIEKLCDVAGYYGDGEDDED